MELIEEAAVKLSKAGAMVLIGHEAIVQTRYLDSKGVWTIGVGTHENGRQSGSKGL